MKLAGLASNRGRNLLNIADRAPSGAEFSVILTNDADAPVLDAAADRGIPTEVVEREEGERRRDHEQRVFDALADYDFELVTLDGYMRLLSDTFVDDAPTTLNVHPSLLPSFPGMDAWGDALDYGAKVAGCTVHVVTNAIDEDGEVIEEEVDGGPVVTQEPVPVYEGDDEDDLADRVLYEGEFKAYPRAVKWFAEDSVTVDDDANRVSVEGDTDGDLPSRLFGSEDRAADLRYGENPHQDAAVYADNTVEEASVVHADQLNEGAKSLSYNNYNDADGALNLIKEFDEPAAAVIKHTNPAGCATADTLADAYADALATDAKSAFGGIVALNRECGVGVPRCDDDLLERVDDLRRGLLVALAIEGDDAAEGALGVRGERVGVGVGEGVGRRTARGVGVFDDGGGRLVELLAELERGGGVVVVVVRQRLGTLVELVGVDDAGLLGRGVGVDRGVLMRVLPVAQIRDAVLRAQQS